MRSEREFWRLTAPEWALRMRAWEDEARRRRIERAMVGIGIVQGFGGKNVRGADLWRTMTGEDPAEQAADQEVLEEIYQESRRRARGG